MDKLIYTGFKDRENNSICLGDSVITDSGVEYIITIDPHLGYVLFDKHMETIEQLNVYNSKQILAVYMSPSLPIHDTQVL